MPYNCAKNLGPNGLKSKVTLHQTELKLKIIWPASQQSLHLQEKRNVEMSLYVFLCDAILTIDGVR